MQINDILGVAAEVAYSSFYYIHHTMSKISGFFDGVANEFKKVSWPTQKELIDNTIIVVVFSIIISVFIFGVDQLYSTILEAIYK